jgi:uncharacterized DUF497 family protein
MDMIPLWTWRNAEHLEKHDVAPSEAEEVVAAADPPYPEDLGDEKWMVRGQTSSGRWLQVVFVYVGLGDVEPDEFAQLRPDHRIALQDGDEAIRIIHARELTRREKRRTRRRGR